MMKLKGGKKSKLPRIEINECKVKTKDQKKLENEMFEQAREARILLDQLLEEGDQSGRKRSNSLNAKVETLLLSNNKNIPKNFNAKARGSVPLLHNLPKKILTRHKNNNDKNKEFTESKSLPSSPNTKKAKRTPLNFIRKQHDKEQSEYNGSNANSWSKNKKVDEQYPAEDLNAECISFKTMAIEELGETGMVKNISENLI